MTYASRFQLIFAVICASLVTVSCDFFNASLPEFLDEYTRSVAAESYTLDDNYPRNAAGIECVPSDRLVTVTVRMRNPQLYEIEANAFVTIEGTSSPYPADILVDLNTKDTVKISLGPLNSTDEGNLVLINMQIKRADGLQQFEPYTVILKCNTVPLMPVPVNYDGTTYTLADNTPWVPAPNGRIYWTYLPAGGIHDDVTEFIVNGEKRPKAGWDEQTGVIIETSGGVPSNYSELYSVHVGTGSYNVSVKAVDTDMLESPALDTGVTLHTVTYDANGGTGSVPAPKTYRPGVLVTADMTPVPVRSGYIFGGWKDDQGKTSADYVSGMAEFVMPDADVTLYAHWVEVTDYYVAATGNPAGDGSMLNPYTTITQAVQAGTAAADNIIIWLLTDINQSGSVTIPAGKTVWLKADGAARTVTRYSGSTSSLFQVEGKLILGDTGNNLTLDGNAGIAPSSDPLVVISSGTFEMNTSSILTNNETTFGGSAVYVGGGTFTMNGGTISNNTDWSYTGGGGVYVSRTRRWP